MRYVVVGAGVAGLTAAYKLVQGGHEVLVLEKESDIGGLSRGFRYGDFYFDIGPHRFFTNINEIYRFIGFVLKGNYIFINRLSSIYLLNRYFSWPLSPGVLAKLPLPILFKIGADLFSRAGLGGADFSSSVIRTYGKTLYQLVFRDYTRKFCCLPGEQLHPDWIKASLDKAIIDKRIKTDSLFDFLSMAYKSLFIKMRFLYPRGGCGSFAQGLAKKISQKKGKIIKGINHISFDFKDSRIAALQYFGAEQGAVEFDHLIYTGQLHKLTQGLNLGIPNLEYLDSILYNIEINRPLKNPNQWIYFGDGDITFSRVSFPGNFDKHNVPAGADSLCVETTCRKDSSLGNNPESIKERLIEDLIKVKLCRHKDIQNIHIEKVTNTYPLYKLDYVGELENTKKQLSRFSNLTCLGRTGTFWYNNMDESIKIGLEAAGNLGK